jgi:hypothetical protein
MGDVRRRLSTLSAFKPIESSRINRYRASNASKAPSENTNIETLIDVARTVPAVGSGFRKATRWIRYPASSQIAVPAPSVAPAIPASITSFIIRTSINMISPDAIR